VPAVVSDATREFREESDPIGAFLESCCVVTGYHEDSIGARDMGDAFNLYLDDRGEGQWKPRTVSIKLKEKSRRWKSAATGQGFTQRKTSTISYDGIKCNVVFGRRCRDAPRDAQGRFLRTVNAADD
jgi:putative DNA primase/helicase